MSKDKPADYASLKAELSKEIIKKQELNLKLAKLEDYIYEKETEYFNESPYGNLVKGFDNFTKGTSNSNKKRIIYTSDDHIFSLSSSNYVKSLLKRQGNPIKDDFDDFEDSVDPPNAESNNPGTGSPGSNGATPGRKRKVRTFDD